jgi:nucleotide-binding universal stress UspA family protein
MKSSVPGAVKPFKAVVGIDFAPTSKGVLLRALSLANAEPSGEVHAVVVADYDRVSMGPLGASSAEAPPDAAVRLQQLATDAVNEFSARVGESHLSRVVTHLLVGAPAQEIVWLAAHVDADLIVVGSHGRKGLSRLLLGSVAERVVRLAGCPVHVVRDKHHDAAWCVPEIEPPCPDCLAARNASGGEELWCERHQSHIHTHVYSGSDAPTRSVRPWGFSA